MGTEGLESIFITEHKMNNMDMQRIVVANPAIIEILKAIRLTEDAQLDAVNALVDRTPEWEEFEPAEAMDKIKTVLTQETVLQYLQINKIIRDKVDIVEVGVDPEGSIVVEAYYTNMSREERRLAQKRLSKQEKEQMAQAVNVLGNENILEKAKAKMEQIQAAEQKKRMAKVKKFPVMPQGTKK